MYPRILVLILPLLSMISCTTPDPQQSAAVVPAQPIAGSSADEVGSITRGYCEELMVGLPQAASQGDPKARITIDSHRPGGDTYEIAQLGKKGTHHEYFIHDIPVPNLPAYSRCAKIPLIQMTSAERLTNANYKITLKNGKTFVTDSNTPFCVKDPENFDMCTTLSGGEYRENEGVLWGLVGDSERQEQQEVGFNPLQILFFIVY